MATIHFDEPSPSVKRSKRSRFTIEWPTLLLALFIHTGWLLLTYFWQSVPFVLLLLVGGWLVAWPPYIGYLSQTQRRRVVARIAALLDAPQDAVGWG